jgi:hypothetical protein
MADEKKESRGGTAAVAGVAAFAGGLIAGLIQRRPAEAAADSVKLDYITKLLEAMGTTEEAILAALRGISLPGAGGITNVETPWIARESITIFDGLVNAVGNFDSDQMVDFRNGKRLVLKAESSLDVNISIQMIGNIDDSKESADDLNGPIALGAGGSITVGLAWDDWMPYIGCRVIVPVAPTAGRLTIRIVVQN